MFRVRAQIRPISNEDATWAAAAASSESKSDFEGEEMKKKVGKIFPGEELAAPIFAQTRKLRFFVFNVFFSSQAAKKRKGKLPRVEKSLATGLWGKNKTS